MTLGASALETLAIARVVVHRDGALVERRGALPVVEGRVVVRGLPLLLDEGSVRAQVTEGALRDLRLDWDLEGLDRAVAPADPAAAVAAAEALAVAEAERAALADQRAAVGRLAPASAAPETLPSPDRLAAWARLGERLGPWLAALDDRLAELDRELIRRRDALAVATHRAHGASTEEQLRHWAPTRVAVLRVEGTDTAELALSYRIPGATWTPAYSLDADALFKRARFTMRALVVQATGEDWSGVQLALSTAPAGRRVDLPELPALRLGQAQPAAPSPWRPLPQDLEALFPEGLPAALPSPRPAPPEPEPAAADDEAAEEKVALPRSMPQAAPMQTLAAAPKRSGGLARALAAGAAMAADAAPRGGHAEQDRAAPGAPVEPPPRSLPSSLDYGASRLASWEAAPGERGRLRPASELDRLAERRLGPEALRRFTAVSQQRASAARAAADRPLPPHHVLPGPVDDAHYRFDADAAVDLPSDGRFHSVAILSEPIELSVRYRAIPRHDARAFRVVTATLERSAPLLAGPVDVLVDGSLILSTPWKGTPGRGALELDLGVEDHLKVARNVRYREESAGIFGGSRRLITEIEVQVASGLAREARVELLERLPVPAGDDVTVDLVDSDPVASEYAGDRDGPVLRGGRKQVLQLPPGGERTAKLTYAVTVGAKDELVGGDRRG